MAIAATVMGGLIGFVSFLISLLALDHSFATSCGIYFATGLLTATLILIAASLPRRGSTDGPIAEDMTTARVG